MWPGIWLQRVIEPEHAVDLIVVEEPITRQEMNRVLDSQLGELYKRPCRPTSVTFVC